MIRATHTDLIRTMVEMYLIARYGERCGDYPCLCDICRRWDALNVLVDDEKKYEDSE